MLEIWDAERFEEEKSGGRTRPLVIECSRMQTESEVGNSEKNNTPPPNLQRLMLVKTANQHIDSRGLFSEVYGNLFAREFGVTTPFPAIIRLGEDFVAALKLGAASRHLNLSPGLAVGCEYLRGLAPVIPSAFRNNEE